LDSPKLINTVFPSNRKKPKLNMQLLKTTLAFTAVVGACNAFVSQYTPLRPSTTRIASSHASEYETSKYYFMEEKQPEQQAKPQAPAQKTIPKKKAKAASHGNAGPFSPAVLLVKEVWGDDTSFNKFRAKVISMHSDVISSFVKTYETPAGEAALKTLFQLVDKDHSGTIEEVELTRAFSVLGFDWLKEKQLKGIFKRADKDGNGAIDMEEWFSAAPSTLRTNLIKLAKKNGGELGFLS
jgi:hypothetical protein